MDLPRIDSVSSPPTYTDSGTPGYFNDASVAPTVLSAQWLNHVARELLGILTGLGGSVDPLNDQQIAPLLLARIAGATPEAVTATHVSGSIWEATVTGWVTRVRFRPATNETHVVRITHPDGRIPLSCTIRRRMVSASLKGGAIYLFSYRHDVEVDYNFDSATNVDILIIWGTAP